MASGQILAKGGVNVPMAMFLGHGHIVFLRNGPYYNWNNCKEKKQKNQLAVTCTTMRSKSLKFIFRKNYYVTFWWTTEITDLLGFILEMSMHNFVEIFLE